MNDNHNPADTSMPITMVEETNEAPIPLRELGVLGDLMRILTRHVETLVDQRFAALVESHKTLALMDENMQTAITEMIDDAIETALDGHTDDYTHHSEGDIESTVSDHFEYLIRQGQHDLVTTRELSEKVGDVLDEILDDRINQALSGASIEITV